MAASRFCEMATKNSTRQRFDSTSEFFPAVGLCLLNVLQFLASPVGTHASYSRSGVLSAFIRRADAGSARERIHYPFQSI